MLFSGRLHGELKSAIRIFITSLDQSRYVWPEERLNSYGFRVIDSEKNSRSPPPQTTHQKLGVTAAHHLERDENTKHDGGKKFWCMQNFYELLVFRLIIICIKKRPTLASLYCRDNVMARKFKNLKNTFFIGLYTYSARVIFILNVYRVHAMQVFAVYFGVTKRHFCKLLLQVYRCDNTSITPLIHDF